MNVASSGSTYFQQNHAARSAEREREGLVRELSFAKGTSVYTSLATRSVRSQSATVELNAVIIWKLVDIRNN